VSCYLTDMARPELSARQRAYELASTGAYLLWAPIAQVLVSEGYGATAVKKLGKDREGQREITTRIHAAIAHDPSPPCATWRIGDPEMKVKLQD
jgi:hypothetical protein